MIAEQLKRSILQAAIQGKLTKQLPEDGNASELLRRIHEEKARLTKDGNRKEKPLSELNEDDIPFDIPENWCWVRLSTIAKSPPQNGYSPKGVSYVTAIKNLTLTATTSGYFKPDEFKYVDIKINIDSRFWLHKYDLLVQRSNSREYVGTSCVFDGTEGEFIYPDLMMKLELLEFVDVWYVDLALKSPMVRTYYMQSAIGTSESMPKINQSIVSNTLIPLPPLAEQKRIVEFVKNMLSKINNLKNDEHKLIDLQNTFPKKMKDSILQYAIQGKLSVQLETDGYSLDLINEIRKEKALLINDRKVKKDVPQPEINENDIPFEIPENWTWIRLTDCCNIYTGNSISETDKIKKYTGVLNGLNYIATKDVGLDNTVNYHNGVKIPHNDKSFRISPSGSTLMCIEGGSAGKKIAIISEDVCFGNKLCSFSPIGINPYYLFAFLQNPFFTKSFFDNITGIIGGVNIKKLKEVVIPIPPIKEQARIVNKLNEILPLFNNLE